MSGKNISPKVSESQAPLTPYGPPTLPSYVSALSSVTSTLSSGLSSTRRLVPEAVGRREERFSATVGLRD